MPWRLGGLVFCLLLSSLRCQNQPKNLVPAFYHWKTQLALKPAETACLDSLRCQYLYLKFLDIAREENSIQPYALLEVLDTTGLQGKTLIPCVFITNNVFQDIAAEQVDWLAQKTATALSSVGTQFSAADFTEIQIDCDWTASTRDAFFSFLKKLRQQLPTACKLSATIRLHQYKFPDRTGVPPVDRGMLMLYNTGNIEDPAEVNSIFQPADAEKYILGAAAGYPLPLDLALPIFSWALVYRNAELWKIIPEPNHREFQDTSRFLPQASIANLAVRRSTFLGGHYLRPGDQLRVELLDTALLRSAAQLANKLDLADDARLAFYHLDSAAICRYPGPFLQSLFKVVQSQNVKFKM